MGKTVMIQKGDTITIGEDISICVQKKSGEKTWSLNIEAPKDDKIDRIDIRGCNEKERREYSKRLRTLRDGRS